MYFLQFIAKGGILFNWEEEEEEEEEASITMLPKGFLVRLSGGRLWALCTIFRTRRGCFEVRVSIL